MPVRLHLDGGADALGAGSVRLLYVNKCLALEAALVPIGCKKCGQSLDVRELVLADAVARPEIAGELLLKLRKAGRATPSNGIAGVATARTPKGIM
jgi:hypothetical protein